MWQTLFRSVRIPGELGDETPDECGWDNPGHTALEEGLSQFRHRLHVHAGNWADAAVPRSALATTMPLAAQPMNRHPGELAGEHSDLALEGDRLVHCTWKQADYTEGSVVRIFNPADKPVEGALRVGFDVKAAEETNFREEHTGELSVVDGRIALTFSPYEIKTVRLSI
jgi:alpha-mannosidase